MQDTDGSLFNPANLPASVLAPALAAGWGARPGVTWHSAVESSLFSPAECVYAGGNANAWNGAFCSPDLLFRRMMLNEHGPSALVYNDLLLVSLATNRSSRVHFSKYNENGYQFTVPTTRNYWVQW
jgi:hypothetical protein